MHLAMHRIHKTRLCLLLLCLAASSTGRLNNGRITGGQDADIKDHPYQLALLSPEGELRGDAVIVSATWALTSPSNLREPDENLTVRAGSSVWFEGGSVHRVMQFITHDLYDREGHDFALALIEVSPPFVFGPGVAAARFPAQDQAVAVGKTSLVSGWGGSTSGSLGSPSDTLQVAEIPVLDMEVCALEYVDFELTARMLCAGRDSFAANLDACNGDEGGPMVVDGVVVGLFLWHQLKGCGYYGLPSLYTKVSSMTSWLLATTGMCCGASALTTPMLTVVLVVGWVGRWLLG